MPSPKLADLIERRTILVARAETQREALSYYVRRLEKPARVTEWTWGVARFLRSPIVIAAIAALVLRKRSRRRRRRSGRFWLLRQAWRAFLIFRRFAK